MTRPAVGAIAPVIRVDGSELKGSLLNALIGMTVRAGLRLPGRARLDFLDHGFSASASNVFGLGSQVKITTADGIVLFIGEITGVELDVEEGAPNLSVIADDPAYKMTLGNKARTFTQSTYADVVTKIAREYGIDSKTTATNGVHEYLLQADSDFGFLTEIADRAGYDWWMDPNGTLQFHPMGKYPAGNATVGWQQGRGGLRNFSVRASALHPQQVTVNGWDASAKRSVTSVNRTGGARPNARLVTPYLDAPKLAKHTTVSTAFRMFTRQSDGTDLATSVAARALAGAVVAVGECQINPAIVVGGTVQVDGVGPASGSYAVTEVEHIYGARGFDTRFTAGDREPTSLVDTLAGPTHSSFRHDALVVGVVTNLGDGNAPPGHVKVKYPALGDKVESAWARVVSTGAGDSRGMTFLPEVNDEVIVGFENGDITRPLVLGGVYSSASAALDYGTANGEVNKRQIVSRLGHVIQLGDGGGPADQHIWLTLAGGEHAVRLGKDGLTATVPGGQPVTLSAGGTKIEIDKQGNIVLSGQKITIDAKQDVEISGLNVRLKGKAAVEASGVKVAVSGSAQAELSSGGLTAVKGGTVAIN